MSTGAAPVTLLRLAFPFPPEKASIDEAFIDFTRPVRAELLARYPYLANAPEGLDTVLPPPPPISWDGRGIVIPVNPPPEDQAAGSAHGTGTDSGITDGDDDVRRTWHDVALSIAAELMDRIRAEVRTQLRYTTSAVGFPRGLTLRSKRFEKNAPARICYRGSRGTNSWPKCVGGFNVYIFICARRLHGASHSSPHRTRSGTRRSGSAGYHVSPRKLIDPTATATQSILRNAAIPNYLIPMPFQKVTGVMIAVYPSSIPQIARVRSGSWVANSDRPSQTSSRSRQLVISCTRHLVARWRLDAEIGHAIWRSGTSV